MEPQISKLIRCALHIACLGGENQGFGAWKEGGNHPGWKKDAGSAGRPLKWRGDPRRQTSWDAQGPWLVVLKTGN